MINDIIVGGPSIPTLHSPLPIPHSPFPTNMPIVAITDYTFPSLEIEESLIRAAGGEFELRSGNDKQVEALKRLVADADAVITQFAPINAEVIAAMQKARVIVRYGIGVDNVDLSAARARPLAEMLTQLGYDVQS